MLTSSRQDNIFKTMLLKILLSVALFCLATATISDYEDPYLGYNTSDESEDLEDGDNFGDWIESDRSHDYDWFYHAFVNNGKQFELTKEKSKERHTVQVETAIENGAGEIKKTKEKRPDQIPKKNQSENDVEIIKVDDVNQHITKSMERLENFNEPEKPANITKDIR